MKVFDILIDGLSAVGNEYLSCLFGIVMVFVLSVQIILLHQIHKGQPLALLEPSIFWNVERIIVVLPADI